MEERHGSVREEEGSERICEEGGLRNCPNLQLCGRGLIVRAWKIEQAVHGPLGMKKGPHLVAGPQGGGKPLTLGALCKRGSWGIPSGEGWHLKWTQNSVRKQST